jgi:hypothetical protein
MTAQDLFVEAIAHGPSLSFAYFNLGNLLTPFGQPGSFVTLRDGRKMSRQDLYLEAIRYNPKLTVAYQAFARDMSDGSFVTLPDGRTLTKADLLALK